MTSRNYGQACAVANFLDRLGSRWTLMIVRDLMIGPRRFKDLLEGLPGIGTNLLAQRLRELQAQEIVEKAAPNNDNTLLYQLTAKGWELEPVVLSMARWGLHYLREDSHGKHDRADLLVVAFRAAFLPEYAAGMDLSCELRIGDTIFHATIRDGNLHTALGHALHPAFVYITESATFNQLVSGTLNEKAARSKGLLDVIGDEKAYERFLLAFNAPPVTASVGQVDIH